MTGEGSLGSNLAHGSLVFSVVRMSATPLKTINSIPIQLTNRKQTIRRHCWSTHWNSVSQYCDNHRGDITSSKGKSPVKSFISKYFDISKQRGHSYRFRLSCFWPLNTGCTRKQFYLTNDLRYSSFFTLPALTIFRLKIVNFCHRLVRYRCFLETLRLTLKPSLLTWKLDQHQASI